MTVSGGHIVSAFDDELQDLSAKISEMGSYSGELMSQAIDALETGDEEVAQQVIDGDQQLDDMEFALERAAINMLALRQPMASDLREIVAAFKIAAALERVGNLSTSIARRALILPSDQHNVSIASTLRMGRQTLTQFSEVQEAYASEDSVQAVSVIRDDKEIDAIYDSVFREVISYMMENPGTIEFCAHLLFIAKNFERIGDYTTYIAEMVYYMVEGDRI